MEDSEDGMSVGEHYLLGMSGFCVHGLLAAVITFIKLVYKSPAMAREGVTWFP